MVSFKRGATDFSSQVAPPESRRLRLCLAFGSVVRRSVGILTVAARATLQADLGRVLADPCSRRRRSRRELSEGLYGVGQPEIFYEDTATGKVRTISKPTRKMFGTGAQPADDGRLQRHDGFRPLRQTGRQNLTTDLLIAAMDRASPFQDIFGQSPGEVFKTNHLGSREELLVAPRCRTAAGSRSPRSRSTSGMFGAGVRVGLFPFSSKSRCPRVSAHAPLRSRGRAARIVMNRPDAQRAKSRHDPRSRRGLRASRRRQRGEGHHPRASPIRISRPATTFATAARRSWAKDFPVISTWGNFQPEGRFAREQEIYLQNTHRWRNLSNRRLRKCRASASLAFDAFAWACDLIVASDDADSATPSSPWASAASRWFVHPWELGPRKAMNRSGRRDPGAPGGPRLRHGQSCHAARRSHASRLRVEDRRQAGLRRQDGEGSSQPHARYQRARRIPSIRRSACITSATPIT